MKKFIVNFWEKGVVPVLIGAAISILTVLVADLTDAFHTEPTPETHTVVMLGAEGPHDVDPACVIACTFKRLVGQPCEC